MTFLPGIEVIDTRHFDKTATIVCVVLRSASAGIGSIPFGSSSYGLNRADSFPKARR
jgi:hypothetical protein